VAENLVLTIAVNDQGSPVVKTFSGHVKSAADTMRKDGAGAADTMTQKFKGLEVGTGGLKTALTALGGALAALGIARLASDTVQTAGKIDGLRTAFTAAAGGAEEGARQFQFVEETSKRLGLELTSTAGSYKGLLAATLASGRSGETAQKIFLGVANATRALGLSNEDAEATMLAAGQVMAKNKITAEELRGQIGERLPIAMAAMATAAGVSTEELDKMMERGELGAGLMRRFGEVMTNEYAPAAEQAALKPEAAFNRMRNAATFLQEAIGKAGLSGAAATLATVLNDLFDRIRTSGLAEQLGGAARQAAEQFALLAQEYGPAAVQLVVDLTNTISANFRPAIDLVTQGWSLMQTAVNLAASTVFSFLEGAFGAFAKLREVTASVQEYLGFTEAAARSREYAAQQREIAANFATLKGAAIETANEWYTRFEQVRAKTYETTDATNKLAQANTAQGVAAKTAGEQGKSAADQQREATALARQEAERLNEALKTLGIQSKDQLSQAATEAMTAWARAFNSGKAAAGDLLKGAVEVKDRMVAAYGKMPDELKPLFQKTAQDATAEFFRIRNSGTESAEQIAARYQKLKEQLTALGLWESMKYQFAGIEQAGVGAANNIGNAHEQNAQRSQEAWDAVFERQKAQAKALQDAYQAINDRIMASSRRSGLNDANPFTGLGGRTPFATDRAGLEKQLKDYQDQLSQFPSSYGVWDQSGDIWENNRQALVDAIAAIKARLAGLSSGDTRQAGRLIGVGETAQAGRLRTARQGERATLGAGELVLDRSMSDGLRDLVKNGGGRGSGVTINNPQFVLQQTGVDPRAMDGRAVLWAMLPALRELFRKADYDPRKI
jgi:tape measure domain-containing protein